MVQKNKQKIDVFYLTGAAYCGSTFLSFVLNTHKDIVSIGEMGPSARAEKNKDYKCSCGERIVKCPFYSSIKNKMSEDGVGFDISKMKLRYRFSENRFLERIVNGYLPDGFASKTRYCLLNFLPIYKKFISEYNVRNLAFMKASLSVAGKKIFFDSTKHWHRIGYLKGIKDINLKVMHLIRDPRGYCNSARKRRGISLEKSATNWLKANSLSGSEIEKLPPDKRMTMRYEQFCSDPSAALKKISDFLSIEPMAVPDNFRDCPHHIIGNRMRESSDDRGGILVDEKWRSELNEEVKTLIAKIAGKLASQYGYDI